MANLHEKSLCCQGKIRRFGGRRRQCALCYRTWTVWPKKRGAKPFRSKLSLVSSYLENRSGPLRNPKLQARTRKAANRFVTKISWAKVPKGKLVAIVDGMYQKIGRREYTFYFILLKPVGKAKAFIRSPLCLPGGESSNGWQQAFNRLPGKIEKEIAALVCDGRRALLLLARKRRYRLQRCHFHLKARVRHYARSGYLSRHPGVGQTVQKLVSVTLTTKDERKLNRAVSQLKVLRREVFSAGLAQVIGGFSRNYRSYRTYLRYPALDLPITSNAAESLIGSVRELQHRARGFRSRRSLLLWVTALLKHRQFVTCNGKNNQQN